MSYFAEGIESTHAIFESGRVLVSRCLDLALYRGMSACSMCPTVFVRYVSVERRVIWSFAWLATTIPLTGVTVVGGLSNQLLHLLEQFQNIQFNRIALNRIDLWLYWSHQSANV